MRDQPPRRQFIQRGLTVGTAALAASMFHVPGAFAEALTLTPRQTEGPFYPNHLPLDTDNDLLIVNDKLTPAAGTVTHFGGRVLDKQGNPIRNAVVEIWQADNNGVYLHTGSADRDNYDTNFQGFGRFLTNRKGEYYFRTIRPVPYGSRTPHIHVAVKQGDKHLLTTQCYVQGEKMNRRDGPLSQVKDKKLREAIIVDFKPIKDSRAGELAANFDIVIGVTPKA